MDGETGIIVTFVACMVFISGCCTGSSFEASGWRKDLIDRPQLIKTIEAEERARRARIKEETRR